MGRAGFHLQSRLRRSFRSWPQGVADSWVSASLHPRLLCGAPSALKVRPSRNQAFVRLCACPFPKSSQICECFRLVRTTIDVRKRRAYSVEQRIVPG